MATVPVHADWAMPTGTNDTVLTTHMWTAPPLMRSSPIHDRALAALRDLKADYVRFLPWFTHPRIAVPALTPPTAATTSWNFGELDPFVEDFMAATAGRPVVANFATIPTWMFHTPEPVQVPDDSTAIQWDYEQGTELRDPTFAEVADYFYRVASWYIAGGFTDELGVWHESGHHYRFAYWEVLCEPDFGHRIGPETYRALYDAVVARLRPLDPEMRFVGLSLSHVHSNPEYYWEFLDLAKHADGVPVDAFSYHFYASPDIANPFSTEENPPYEHWRDIFFARADGFLEQVRYIDSIRRRLAPEVKTFINELGTYPSDVMNPEPRLPDEYWALSASVQSYLWASLVDLGVDLVGIAEFMDYPSMIPGLTLLDWETGEPNARYRALALLIKHFGPGDTLVSTSAGLSGYPSPRLHAQAFVTTDDTRKVLLVNKTGTTVTAELDDVAGFVAEQVSTETGAGPAVSSTVENGHIVLAPYATAVLSG